ncbi:LOW QUALITY PROTEIN: probable E3 ubiquitin-protein ligase TRIML1 [Sarcophilus harrisii]|uniref:LOW QUALITY PROTEIN: probable E3 ubiquitin-protein ligase TRIML1 n=1 Tax=Sarcophilus harrisii TaxID=9305 RepID=UPI001301AEBD|nr:LOW QUALITY PROTEIN: probable E3 ubiquitin-protein ligase TRIML1 [Sarcophilus harrisii]
MASTSELIQDLQKELICCIYREYFTNPVTIECGHNFCHSRLSSSWQQGPTPFSCPECRSVSQMQDFQVNVQLGKLAAFAKELRLHYLQYPDGHDKCEVHQKLETLFCEDDQRPICMSCSQSQEHEVHKLFCIDEAAENFRKIKRFLNEEKDTYLSKVEAETTANFEGLNNRVNALFLHSQELRKRSTELEEECKKPDLDLLLSFNIYRNESVLQKKIETFQMFMTIPSITGFMKKIFKFKVNITLDCNTADPGIIISEDMKSMRYGGVQEEAPDNNGRLTDFAQVLAIQSFVSGRHYWKVQVSNNTVCCFGICKKKSKESQDLFVLRSTLKHNSYLLYATSYLNLCSQVHRTYCMVSVCNLKVGIFLDYERGEISFYHVENRYLIYTFPTTSFSGPLMPIVSLSKKVLTNDSNDYSLTICS